MAGIYLEGVTNEELEERIAEMEKKLAQ